MVKPPVHEMFRQAAADHPAETAISSPGLPLTYGRLDRRSDALGRLLVEAGASPGTPVGILVQDASSLVAGIIGCLKAGCAFVPFDLRTPETRLREMLAEAQVRWLIAETEQIPLLAQAMLEGAAPRIVVAGPLPGEMPSGFELFPAGELPEDSCLPGPDVPRDGDDLAYIYFTSGSTGRPKGIAGRLKAIDHYIRWEMEALGAGPGLRVSQLISPAFDASLRDIFLPLCAGGTLCAPEGRETILEANQLAAWLTAERVEVVHCVPSLFRILLERRPAPGDLAALRHVLLAGEPLLPLDVRRWIETYGSRAQLVNLYGPSETTMTKLFYFVSPADAERDSVPIGKPMPGARAIVVNRKGRICAPGVVGEIYIRTPYRALGYFNRPDLTREVFVPNPFGSDPEDLVYKTGDFGRVLEDGNFEFLGRADHQVKIRGVRIELPEIEGVLRAQPGVLDVAVVDREDVPGQRYLCAYLVGPEAASLDGLREACAHVLPEAMVPAVFEILDTLPRTISGKVERRALPPPSRIPAAGERAYAPPRNAFEEMMVNLWRELLGARRIGVDDNFFHSGGHSLLATQLLSRIRGQLGVEIPLRALFEQPTPAGLAQRAAQALREGTRLEMPPLSPVPRDGGLPLSFAQQRLWLVHQLEPDSPAYNMPLALRLRGRLDLAAVERSLDEIVRRHEILRTTFPAREGRPVQVAATHRPFAVPLVDLRYLSPEEAEEKGRHLARAEARRPFDLEQGPLLRVSLLRFGEEDHTLLFTTHHIVSDGWSEGVLVREFTALYCGGSSLPALPVQYADFAVWQRGWLEGEPLERLLAFWEERLAGELPVLALGSSRPAARTGRGARSSVKVSAETADALRELGQREGATLFMTLLAIFQTLLHQESGQTDFLVGTEVASRSLPELEPMIGFFVNLLALRACLQGNPTFRELLVRAREAALQAYAHQELPFEKLVERLQPERQAGEFPLLQAVLVLQNAGVPALELPGLETSPYRLDDQGAKFDLLLMLYETDAGGLGGVWTYSTDLFSQLDIDRLSRNFQDLMKRAAEQPEVRLDTLTGRAEPQRRQAMKPKMSSFSSFLDAEPEAVQISAESLVKTGSLADGQPLPLVIEAAVQGVGLAEWASGQRDRIERDLAAHGAILFRGFEVSGVEEFERFSQAFCSELFGDYGDLPAEKEGQRVYRSTPYPEDKTILFHNESSHLHSWPLKQWFFCVQASQRGGETPIVDCRLVYQRLDPGIRERFESEQLMYVRNFTDGLDVSWQEFFRTSDRAEVEERCRRFGMDFEWTPDGLRTRRVSPAVLSHPSTGEKIFFNQIQIFHPSSLDPEVRRSMVSLFGEDRLPRDVRYGDGSPIEDGVLDQVRQLYWDLAASFPWREGDVLMVDNMLTAHARNPFSGPRKIVVAMGDMVVLTDLV